MPEDDDYFDPWCGDADGCETCETNGWKREF